MKRREKILDIDPLLSKTLDSFCLELTVTQPDENSLGLIEILDWRLKNQISKEQFSQLYKAWIQSKSITNIFKTKQTSTIDKAQLLASEKMPHDFWDIHKITKALEFINQEYNIQFIEIYERSELLQNLELLFSYLDPQGVIHIRISHQFFLFQALIQAKIIQIKDKNIKSFFDHFKGFLNEICTVNGKLSLRNFKNYMIQKCNSDQVITIMKLIREIEKSIGKLNALPDIFEQSCNKWKSFPRFQSHKKRFQQYKRIFEENDYLFFELNTNSEQIEATLANYYGKSCLMLHDIDFIVIRQFQQVVKQNIQRYIKLFLGNTSNNKTDTERVTTRTPIVSKQMKIIVDKEFSKERSTNKYKNSSNNLSISANRTQHRKTLNMITPTKASTLTINSLTPSKFQLAEVKSLKNTNKIKSKKTEVEQQNSQIYNSNTKTQSLLQHMTYFKNKKIETYEVVMKRLKKK